jgi:oligoendopeptidase F
MTTQFRILMFALISSVASAQSLPSAAKTDQNVPTQTPNTVPAGQHINWARHFFISPEAEKAARHQLYEDMDSFQQWKGQLAQSGKRLSGALEAKDKLTQKYMLHGAYLHLKYATDTRDAVSQRDESRLDADFERKTAFVESEILAISAEKLVQFMAETPGLTKYRFEIEKTQRNRTHARPLPEEELLRGLSPELTDWQSNLYDQLGAEIKIDPITVDGQKLDPQRDRRKLAANPDSTVRQEAFARRYVGFERMAPIYAFTLARLVDANNRLAGLHNFKSAPEQFYWRSFLTPKDVDHLLSGVVAQADVYKNYERVRAQHVERALGLKQAKLWDLDAAPTPSRAKFSFDDVRTTLARALAPLGEEYVREMNALLDPANGRADVSSSPNRRRTGFSKGFPGFSSVFFAGDFTGTYDDMRVVAHEGGHAVHRELMTKNHVDPAYAEGPHFLFESFAILNEFLLADYLSAEAKTPEMKSWYLEQFLTGKGTVAFVAGAEAELEQRIYLEAQAGKTLDAAALNKLTTDVYNKYSIYGPTTPELRSQWMMIPLMYNDAFYDVNYVYAAVLALKYYEMLQNDPQKFRNAYVALLKNGFDVPPQDLLKKFLSIDIQDPTLVEKALSTVAIRVEQLDGLYRKAPPLRSTNTQGREKQPANPQ